MQQNSEEWLKWRQEGLGASDAPAIMGASDYLTPFELWQIKTGKAKQKADAYITSLGHKTEDKVRALFEMDCGESFPTVCIEFADAPFIRASLDGRGTKSKRIIEIKMVGAERYASKELTEAFKWQATQQMFCSGEQEVTFLFARTPDAKKNIKLEYYTIRYEREPKRIRELYVALFEFKACIDNNTPPGGVNEITDKSVKKLLAKWNLLKKKQSIQNAKTKKIKDLADECELQIEEKVPAGIGKSLAFGYYLERGTKEGTYDWDKVPEDIIENLKKYRKKSSETFSIKKSKLE